MQKNRNNWMFKTVSDEDRSYRSHDGYEDVLSSQYVFDSNVANSKQVKTGDFIVLVDKNFILGFAKISRIKKYSSTKNISRCPIENCGNTTYDIRKTKTPIYRCNKGHEFDELKSDTVSINKFEAYYGNSFVIEKKKLSIDKLKPYFINNYNRNMSIQKLDQEFFKKIDISLIDTLKNSVSYIDPDEGNTDNDESKKYSINLNDEREKVYRAIKARRGQKKFREKLLKKYNETCCVTGCTIKHILDAAHIKPYRGKNDNHLSNGLLLRTDVHTLFDLDLLGIHPEKLTIHLNQEVSKDGYELLEKSQLHNVTFSEISNEALKYKWKLFIKNK